MASRSISVQISATEMPHFRRLVDFLEEVERLADDRLDLELRELVEQVRDDFLRMESR